jgi:hypothetical protein
MKKSDWYALTGTASIVFGVYIGLCDSKVSFVFLILGILLILWGLQYAKPTDEDITNE